MFSRRTTLQPKVLVGALLVALATGLAVAADGQNPPRTSVGPGPLLPGVQAPTPPTLTRLMVFSFQHQRASEALTTVRGLLSTSGSVALDEATNTLSVRDTAASLARISSAVRTIDHASQPVRIEVQLIHAEVARISPVPPSPNLAPDILARLRQLFRYQHFALLARGRIETREGELVAYEMGNGYRLTFQLGTVLEGRRLRLSGFHMARVQPGKQQLDLVRTTVNLGLDQPLILGLTKDEASNRALMLILRYQPPDTPVAGD